MPINIVYSIPYGESRGHYDVADGWAGGCSGRRVLAGRSCRLVAISLKFWG